jgi:predicted phage terminase large subunit-like protein
VQNKQNSLLKPAPLEPIYREAADNGTFGEYCILIDKHYSMQWFHAEIARQLEDGYRRLERGENVRLMIFMPPRHGKSDTATQKFPSWVLGKRPEWPIMISSYSDELATDFGMLTRNIMQSDEYSAMFDTKLRSDAKAKGKWVTNSGGSYTAVGVGGALTGRGFKIGIIDDPFKNREEADSAVVRESRYNWYRSTFYTRQEGASMIVFILTRWHEDDLAGRVLRDTELAKINGEPYDEWDIISYKALATENDDHRLVGDALWPAKFNRDKLLTMKTAMGSYEFSALYQQNPIDEENRKFKHSWFRYKPYEQLDPATTYNVMTIDPRGKDDIKEGKDFVGVTVNFIENARGDNPMWHFMSYREKLSATGIIDLLFTNWNRYHLRKIGIEDNQFTQGLLFSIKEEMRKRGIYLDLTLLKTGGAQKELRIEALVPRYEHGGIYHLTYAGQNQCVELEEELKLFPKASNDDASDSAAYQLPMPSRAGVGTAGVVDAIVPGERAQPTFSIANGYASGGQINIGKALKASNEDY